MAMQRNPPEDGRVSVLLESLRTRPFGVIQFDITSAHLHGAFKYPTKNKHVQATESLILCDQGYSAVKMTKKPVSIAWEFIAQTH
jgi:hypothetical protein